MSITNWAYVKGMPVILKPEEEENRIYVLFEKKGFFTTKHEVLGYLTRSEDLLDQMDRGHKIIDPQVAGFYTEDWGKQLILQITVER